MDFDTEIGLEEVNDGEIGGGLAIRDRAAREQEPAVGAVRVGELIEQAGLAHARLADDCHHLALPGPSPLPRLAELVQFGITPHEARQAPRRGGLQPRAHRSGTQELVDLNRLLQSLHRHGPQRCNLDETLDQAQRVSGQQARTRSGKLFQARCQVRRLPHCRIVHMQITANGTHHNLARVQPHADLHVKPLRVVAAPRHTG